MKKPLYWEYCTKFNGTEGVGLELLPVLFARSLTYNANGARNCKELFALKTLRITKPLYWEYCTKFNGTEGVGLELLPVLFARSLTYNANGARNCKELFALKTLRITKPLYWEYCTKFNEYVILNFCTSISLYLFVKCACFFNNGVWKSCKTLLSCS